ncbi:ABC transporter substrate-binding protein [Paenibacillus sp. NPDC056579]|uniref:ABC transporter substrate-binding protein n=1 Tax=unclassified Paenibacillus TaxID=185978 RepID=UPI001EF8DFC8|nr:ABC transporter substrate-binding protein [Paenibacillus sp. H1-7]ULL13031.1 ABC transporter substrate-binding protein [Paenibacillus sp. H1-7]
MKKGLSLLLSLVLVLGLLAACTSGGTKAGEGGDKPPASNGKVELVFWSLFSGGDGDFMQQMIDSFNKDNPNIQVKNVMLEWGEYYTKLITGVSSGNGPDIGVSHTSKLPELIKQGVVTELDAPAKLSNLDWSSFNQNIMNATMLNGKHYAVPIDTHPFIFFYNKALLKQAGLLDDKGKPIMTQSAQGFVDFAVKLKSSLQSNQMAFAFPSKGDDPYRLWWALYTQLGGKDVIADDLKTPSIDMAKAVQAANYIKDLYHKQQVIPLNLENFTKSFQAGNAGFFMSGVWNTGTMEQTNGLDFGVMPIPKFFDKQATWGDSHTLILPIQKKEDQAKQKAAITFMNYIADHGQIWAKAGHIPAKSKIVDDPEFKKLPYRSDYVAVADTVSFNKPSAYNWAVKTVVIRNLDTIWNNSVPTEDAFKKMIEEMKTVIK